MGVWLCIESVWGGEVRVWSEVWGGRLVGGGVGCVGDGGGVWWWEWGGEGGAEGVGGGGREGGGEGGRGGGGGEGGWGEGGGSGHKDCWRWLGLVWLVVVGGGAAGR